MQEEIKQIVKLIEADQKVQTARYNYLYDILYNRTGGSRDLTKSWDKIRKSITERRKIEWGLRNRLRKYK
jgi:hypothetical protein